MDDDWLLGEAGVFVQRFLYLFFSGGVLLPGQDGLLEHFGPGAIEVHLFARALVHNFKAVAGQLVLSLCCGRGSACRNVCLHVWTQMEHRKGFRVVKHLHGDPPFISVMSMPAMEYGDRVPHFKLEMPALGT